MNVPENGPTKRGSRIATREDARRALDEVLFCYMCGEPLPILYLDDASCSTDSDLVNADHVVAKQIFNDGDRDFPLKLRVHKECHKKHGDNDNSICELLKLLNRPEDSAEIQRLDMRWEVDSNGMATRSQVKNLPMRDICRRWLKGFHAALYGEYLPDPVNITVVFPFHEYDTETGRIIPPDSRHKEIARHIIVNRDCRNIDSITMYNNRFRYECVWKNQPGGWICCFAMEIDGWSIFSPDDQKRTCLGSYHPGRTHPPAGATIASHLIAEPTAVSLDLFPSDRQRYTLKAGQIQRKKIVESKRPRRDGRS